MNYFKSIFLIAGFLILSFSTFAQPFNPLVTNLGFTPGPGGSGFECGTTTQLNFESGLTTSPDAPLVAGDSMEIHICLTGFEWNGTNPASIVSGNYSGNFNWSFDAGTPSCLIGVQNTTLLGTNIGEINVELLIPAGMTNDVVVDLTVIPASYMDGTNNAADDYINNITTTFCPDCPATANFSFSSTIVGACNCSSTAGYMDFSAIPFTPANPSDTIYGLPWPGQPDIDVAFNSLNGSVHGQDLSASFVGKLQPEYGQFLGYDNTTIPHLQVSAPTNETVDVVYDFEYAHQNFDLLIYYIDRHDVLTIEAKDADGNLITDFSNWTVVSYGDVTYFDGQTPNEGPVWDPTLGRLTAPNVSNSTISFIALRPDIPVSEIQFDFQAGSVDATSNINIGLYGWGACTSTLDVEVAWPDVLPLDPVVRLDGTNSYIPIPPTATSPFTANFDVLADGANHTISITNLENDCSYPVGDSYLAATSCQEYCDITITPAITHATSCSAADGEIIITATGGSTPYEYSMDAGVTWQSSNTFSNLTGNTKAIISVRNVEGTCHDNEVHVVHARNTLLQVGDGLIAHKPDAGNVTLGIKKIQPLPHFYSLDSTGYDVSHSIPESTAPTSTWTTADFGGHSIFSTAFNAYTTDIYAATSSLYALHLNSTPRIYSIDAGTGVSSLLAELPGNHGIGGMDYDSLHFQIFASNMDDGKIYRISCAGTVLSEFDPMVADNGAAGLAPRGERVTAVTVNYAENRLYYGVWATDYSDTGNPNTIRSVGLTADGEFMPGTDQLEITLPVVETNSGGPLTYSMPVFDIQFNNTGTTMLMAESGFNNLSATPHRSRVLQYDGASGSWARENTLPTDNQYHKFEMGYLHGHTGARGGVAFAYQNTDSNLEHTTGDYNSFIATGDALTGSNCNDFIKGCAYGLYYGEMTGSNSISAVIYDVDNYLNNDVNATQDEGFYGDIDVVLGQCDLLKFDFGDAPDTSLVAKAGSYNTEYHHNGPYHQIVEGLTLGTIVDADSDAAPTTMADGDDMDGTDDEDGIFISNTNPAPGETITMSIIANNTTGTIAHLEGWIDWNGNGDFTDPGEKVVDVDDSSGSMPIFEIATVPALVATGVTLGARFRISHTNDMAPTGFLASGEVEEYALEVQDISYKIGNYVWHDEDGDGDKDAGEAGIGGVTINLYDIASNFIAMTTTDADGGYIFDVAPSTYVVVVDNFTLPSHLNEPTFDMDGGFDHTYIMTLNEDYLEADFGYNYVAPDDTNNPGVVNGAIGNRVWSDDNSNGIQEAGEVGIENVDLLLLDESNSLVATATTDEAGFYIFNNIAAGIYSVELDLNTLPARFNNTPTGEPDGDQDNITELFVLAPGDVIAIDDFGYNDPNSYDIGNKIYLDANASASFDAGELPLVGVTVALVDDVNSNGIWDFGEIPIATTQTNASGNYLFTGAGPGDYVVAVTDTENVLTNLVNTVDNDGGADGFSGITIVNFNNLDQDFGYTPKDHTATDGLIGDLVFLDADGDNAFSTGDTGIEGVEINLYDNSNALFATTETDANGLYLFGGLPADTYRVEINVLTLPIGVQISVDPDGGNDHESTVILAAGAQDLDQDFGYQATQSNTISGTIWKDMDANGTMDEDTLIYFENVTVLLKDINNNRIATKMTDASGAFAFTGIPDGDYTVDVTDDYKVLNGFWKSNGTNTGADDNSQLDTYDVNVTGGATNVTADFGYFIDPASIGNRVWLDNNNNGLQDPNETGMPETIVTLEIEYPSGVILTTQTMTDDFGFYSFENLMLDEDIILGDGGTNPTYTLSIATPPTNFYAGTVDVNSNGNDMEDSDDLTGVLAVPEQGQENVLLLESPNSETAPASYDFGLAIDCSAPMMEYAITDGTTQTTDYFYTGPAQDSSGLQLNLHTPEMQEHGVLRARDYCVDGDWRYYYNPMDSDEFLFAIDHGDNVTEIEYVEIRVADNPADRYAINATDATFVMARDWHVRTVDNAPLLDQFGAPTTVDVRFYFPAQEFIDLLAAGINQAVNNWSVPAPTIANIYWFKRPNFNPDVHINPTGTLMTPFNITGLQNAATSAFGINSADGIVGSIGNGKNHIQFNGIDGFSGGSAALTMNVTSLPVELASFEAEIDECDVTLKWESKSEEGFSHYIVEKSLDGKSFKVLGTVEAQAGNAAKKYDFEDEGVRGNYFYRLKMIDFDGSVEYSDIVSAKTDCDSEVGNILVYPNPVSSRSNTITIEFETKEAVVFVAIVDKLGKPTMQFPIDANLGNNVLSLDVSNLAAGTYYVNLQFNKSKTKTTRFIKIEE